MDSEQPTTIPVPRRTRKWLFVIPVLMVIAMVVFIYWLLHRNWVSTDDAQVSGDIIPVTARISGYVKKVYIEDNQSVAKGDILVQLDRRNLYANLQKDRASIAQQQALARAAANQLSITGKTAASNLGVASANTRASSAGVGAAVAQIRSAQEALRTAQANLQTAIDAVQGAQDDLKVATSQIGVANANLRATESQVTSAQAQAKKLGTDVGRYEFLYNRGAVSKQTVDEAQAAYVSAQANLAQAQEGVSAARAAVSQAIARRAATQSALRQAVSRTAAARALVGQAQTGITSARASFQESIQRMQASKAAVSGANTVPQQILTASNQYQAAIAKIRQSQADQKNSALMLSYSSIYAPVSGEIGQKSVEPGQYVQPGQMLMSVVPLQGVWIIANFKETQIGKMKSGQTAEVYVDTYPKQTIRGRVASFGAATGAVFSLLPPENATGNFVKVVQRVPIKIIMDRPLPNGIILRPGMNVVVRVNIAS